MAGGLSRAEQRNEVVERVRERIVARVQLGLVGPGDRLPSARVLARELEVDRRLVLGAFARLEAEGLLQRRPRSGVFLARSAPVPGGPAERVNEWLADVLVDGLARGIRIPELPQLVRQAVRSLRLNAVCIECNTDQLHALCRELGEDYGMTTRPLELQAALHAGEDEQRVLEGADVIITTSWHRREVDPLARRLEKPVAGIELNPELWRELARLLEKEPVYVIAQDPRLGPKLRALFKRGLGSEQLHFLVHGRDDTETIPRNAIVYVTRAARSRLVPRPDLRLVPEERVFALDSARSLLRRLLQSDGR